MPLTYTKYLQVDELLKLQQPLSDDPEHDEMLFIITHQVYELWFKQIIHELNDFQSSLNQQNLPTAMRNLKRVLHILKVLVAQMDIIETLSPSPFVPFVTALKTPVVFNLHSFVRSNLSLAGEMPMYLFITRQVKRHASALKHCYINHHYGIAFCTASMPVVMPCLNQN